MAGRGVWQSVRVGPAPGGQRGGGRVGGVGCVNGERVWCTLGGEDCLQTERRGCGALSLLHPGMRAKGEAGGAGERGGAVPSAVARNQAGRGTRTTRRGCTLAPFASP